jgi:Zn-dependent protease
MLLSQLFTDPIYFCRVVVILVFSICFHELAHGWAAIEQGDDTPIRTGRMTLNPVVHMGVASLVLLIITGLCWGQMPVNPNKFRNRKFGSIIVSAAGLLSNLLLALLSTLIISFSLHNNFETVISAKFFYMAASLNMGLFLFNILPIPPLDGFSIVCEFWQELKCYRDSSLGLMILVILCTTGLVSNIFVCGNLIVRALIGM